MEQVFDTSRLVTAAKTVGAALVDARKAKNEMKGRFVEARIIGQLSDGDAYDILIKALHEGAKSAKGGSKGLTESELTLIRQDVAQARKLVANWSEVPANMHAKIFSGSVKISSQATAAKNAAIAKRDAAKRNEEAEAATIAANATPADTAPRPLDVLPEDGPEVMKGSDGQPRKQRSEPIGNLAQGMLDIAAWLANGPDMTDAEQEAFLALQGAMEAFAASEVPLQEAA